MQLLLIASIRKAVHGSFDGHAQALHKLYALQPMPHSDHDRSLVFVFVKNPLYALALDMPHLLRER